MQNPSQSGLFIFLPIGGLLLFLLLWIQMNGNEFEQNHSTEILAHSPTPSSLQLQQRQLGKHKGVHIFGHQEHVGFQQLKAQNIEWICLVAWAFQEDHNSTELNHHNGDSVMIQNSNAHWVERIRKIRAEGLKVFVKPHVWISNHAEGKWRSDIYPDNEADWELWKENYRDFILRYARLAEEAEAEMFCMGTELSRLSVERPEYWRSLIREVRSIYSGQLTYAANWYEEYEEITFWDELDYIGIQAYFPLSNQDRPTVAEISEGWEPHLKKMNKVHRTFQRDILFTEMGYKSTANSATKPWEWLEKSEVQAADYCPDTQANCYTAFFQTVWDKEWFAGVHLWQMRSDYTPREKLDFDFTPQGKPAMEVIVKGFAE